MDFVSSQPSSQPLTISVSNISRADRWQVHQRLQVLSIDCECLADGQLQARVPSPIAALQLRSVIQQYTASRTELLHWLERCWHSDG